ncbi:hypothetical protein EDB80DRAFT_692101 [Ilyonectria destructans]|nr:hypothetical protein EDB80DRAFT_692101 [Ilyonectria destructans]
MAKRLLLGSLLGSPCIAHWLSLRLNAAKGPVNLLAMELAAKAMALGREDASCDRGIAHNASLNITGLYLNVVTKLSGFAIRIATSDDVRSLSIRDPFVMLHMNMRPAYR